MSNYMEYNDTIAFHPGYYMLIAEFKSDKELVEDSSVYKGL